MEKRSEKTKYFLEWICLQYDQDLLIKKERTLKRQETKIEHYLRNLYTTSIILNDNFSV